MPRYKVPSAADLNGWGGVELDRGKRPAGRLIRRRARDIEKEMLRLAGVSITEIVSWETGADGNPVLRLKDPAEIAHHAKRAIKKIKITPGKDGAGPAIEVELIDKVKLLQMIATSAGILDKVEKERDHKLPSVIDMKMVGPGESGTDEREPESPSKPDV